MRRSLFLSSRVHTIMFRYHGLSIFRSSSVPLFLLPRFTVFKNSAWLINRPQTYLSINTFSLLQSVSSLFCILCFVFLFLFLFTIVMLLFLRCLCCCGTFLCCFLVFVEGVRSERKQNVYIVVVSIRNLFTGFHIPLSFRIPIHPILPGFSWSSSLLETKALHSISNIFSESAVRSVNLPSEAFLVAFSRHAHPTSTPIHPLSQISPSQATSCRSYPLGYVPRPPSQLRAAATANMRVRILAIDSRLIPCPPISSVLMLMLHVDLHDRRISKPHLEIPPSCFYCFLAELGGWQALREPIFLACLLGSWGEMRPSKKLAEGQRQRFEERYTLCNSVGLSDLHLLAD
ncbi:hypothetical protein SISNIDRAFT_249724 [Sistotremastrum niveocremeum HHB9708]|uniref:Uncharacterized protein n=2 Tax=Sistotremastraceae TaxID=3402574 RepID=A0A164YWJ9_9AGAM|nr:hypothetical protein SISNIDRAFT_249724 [Sistotremastrum niveocremeum HHB9708]KZT36489.1 hypothetical protein SISSUDRAFT_65111 [Sistotremastrum suecicum HHB10207 ss-3]